MSGAVLITVRLHDGRYHGVGDEPPCPARLFQALVAGAGLSGPLRVREMEALEWLERCTPATVASPTMRRGQAFRNFVPNNDLDAKGGDPRRIGDIRTEKPIQPLLIESDIPFLYAWAFPDDRNSVGHAKVICALAERLYQFGRGVDFAWAWGEVIDEEVLNSRLAGYQGIIYRPTGLGGGRRLACPQPGSLKSLEARHLASRRRFRSVREGRTLRQLFAQRPKPRFVRVAYESPPSRQVYDLRGISSRSEYIAWPLEKALGLVVQLRDGAVGRLREARPDWSANIERVMVGRKADGADDVPASLRVRILPLPSIGHDHADHRIRRVLVEVPAGCALRADDVHWAFSGLEIADTETGEIVAITQPGGESMLTHYGVTHRTRSRVWRTVTPAALPVYAKRRRIDPARQAAEAKGGGERAAEQARAAGAVVQALRHAEVRTAAEAIRLQREPFDGNGKRAGAFSQSPRFGKERLWHVEITFCNPVSGPLVIGDGRFLGLGVMAPVRRAQGIHVFAVEEGLVAGAQPAELARALRRAVMARVQDVFGRPAKLPAFFSGHEVDGSIAETERHPHLTFAFDPASRRLLIVAPYVIERRPPSKQEAEHLDTLESALTGLRELRAGAAGRLTLCATSIDVDRDPLLAASRVWESLTPYQVTRHKKAVGGAEALSADLCAECRRRGLPEPGVTPLEWVGVPGVGLIGKARLMFHAAVKGPVILGKSRHLGGGLFSSVAGD